MNKLLVAVLPMALATSAIPALAADYDPPIVIDAVDDYVPVEVGNGWYLRGDLGYAFSIGSGGKFTYRTFDPLSSTVSPPRTWPDVGKISSSVGATAPMATGHGFEIRLPGCQTMTLPGRAENGIVTSTRVPPESDGTFATTPGIEPVFCPVPAVNLTLTVAAKLLPWIVMTWPCVSDPLMPEMTGLLLGIVP